MLTFCDQYLSGLNDEALEELTKQLQDGVREANGLLHSAKAERERADKDVKECTEEMHRRMRLAMQTGEAGEALVELDLLLKRKTQLSHQLELEASKRKQDLRNLREMEQSLTEKEKRLTSQYVNMKKILEEAQSHCETAKRELQVLNQQASVEKQTFRATKDLTKNERTRIRQKKPK